MNPGAKRAREHGSLVLHAIGLARNLYAGLRVALLLPVRGADFRASPEHYALLVAFNFLVWLATGAAHAGFAGELNLAAIPLYFAAVPLVLAAALAVAALYGRRELLLLVAVAFTASEAMFAAAGAALAYVAPRGGMAAALVVAFVAWSWLAALRAVAVTAGTHRPQIYQGALVATALVGISFFALPRSEAWLEPAQEEPPPRLGEERIFHLQGEMIERGLAAIRPNRRGAPALYFVGFAPDGSQDVFAREMRYVRRLFDERFGTRGRSIALVSEDSALEEFPIATVTNLRRALARVAAVMNPEQDALFLYLSAHGDERHRLSAWQPPVALAELNPTVLARLLQDAGIRWKIVVVSACFSGGYIEPLRDASTVVMTAAAADRQSFGCQHGNDFTVFGRAFFADALARTGSFLEAFARAREIIGRAEVEEQLEPSLPQIWVGAEIAPRLHLYAPR